MKQTKRQQKTVLVTGGAGFLGSHLCRSLLDDGLDVICLDDFSSGSPRHARELQSHPGFSMLERDVISPIDLEVDEIYNMACVASPVRYQKSPLQTLRTSVAGTDNMLQLALRRRARLFQASTSEVYGDPHIHPQSEDYCGNVNPLGERACYDEGKRCAETLCMDYRRVHGVELKIARIFNTYGPRMQPGDGRVVSNFIVQALLNRPLTIYGNGSQTRSFCYVEDLIRGIRALMQSPPSVIGPINLGNPNEVTVLELAETILHLTGSSSDVTFLPLPADDPVKRRPNIQRAKTLLDWQPVHGLEYGLLRTIEYFERLLTEEGTGVGAPLQDQQASAQLTELGR